MWSCVQPSLSDFLFLNRPESFVLSVFAVVCSQTIAVKHTHEIFIYEEGEKKLPVSLRLLVFFCAVAWLVGWCLCFILQTKFLAVSCNGRVVVYWNEKQQETLAINNNFSLCFVCVLSIPYDGGNKKKKGYFSLEIFRDGNENLTEKERERGKQNKKSVIYIE